MCWMYILGVFLLAALQFDHGVYFALALHFDGGGLQACHGVEGAQFPRVFAFRCGLMHYSNGVF